MRIVLLGPPGSGKGTQGELLSKKFQLSRLSVGALLRRHSKEKTSEGKEAEEFINRGLAIPSLLLIKMLSQWFFEYPKGFIVDNLVRTQEQLEEFEKFQRYNDFQLDVVFFLKVSEQEARKRLIKRSFEKDREDETSEAIHQRFIIFYKNNDNILEYFRQ